MSKRQRMGLSFLILGATLLILGMDKFDTAIKLFLTFQVSVGTIMFMIDDKEK